MLKKILICCILIVVLVGSTACSSEKTNNDTLGKETQKQEESSTILPTIDKEIQFSDFLVERCVRKTLNKGWDEPIKQSEAASIKKLLIDNVYNPSLGMNWNMGVPGLCFYEGYIDLVDLQYLTGLEVLQIDNNAIYDAVVNIESIGNCKKLKKLYMQCSIQPNAYYLGEVYGYKYWSDIIAQLPELEYVDFGFFVDDHMKQVLLSKTDNQQIEFYNGKNNIYSESVSFNDYKNGMELYDINEYTGVLKYEYNGNDIDDINGKRTSGTIPVLRVESEEELKTAIQSLDANTEDLSIMLWEDCATIDCNLFLKFKKLTTLTIIKEGAGMYYGNTYPYAQLNNLDSLSQLSQLQVVNLGACKADISSLKNINKLRELSLMYCDMDNMLFASKLENLTELKLWNNDYSAIPVPDGNFQNLKFYKTGGGVNLVERMPQLECFSVIGRNDDAFDYVANCKELEYLIVEGYDYENYNFDKLSKLNNLKNITVNIGNYTISNIDALLKLPALKVICIEGGARKMKSYEIESFVQNAAKNDRLSVVYLGSSEASLNSNSDINHTKEILKLLYEKGIYDAFIQRYANRPYPLNEEWDFHKEYSSIYEN